MQILNIKHSNVLFNLGCVLWVVTTVWLSACTTTNSEPDVDEPEIVVVSAVPDVMLTNTPTSRIEEKQPLAAMESMNKAITQSTNPQLIWFYKPPRGLDAETLLQKFDSFILTKNDEEFRDTLYEIKPDAQILQYVHFDVIHDPCGLTTGAERDDCTCETAKPYSNNVAWLPQDICDIIAHHPDWFLRDKHGNYIYNENFIYMDPGNQEWREFWLDRVKYSQEVLGWNGVYLDNVEGSIGRQTSGDMGLLFYDDETYRQQVNGFLQYIYEVYFEPEGIQVYANIIGAEQTSTWLDYIQYLDGALNESWAAGWHDTYFPPEKWEQDLALAELIQAQGKDAILIMQGSQDNTQRQLFAFASYLLVQSERAYFRYAHSSAYREAWLYDNYAYDIGDYINMRYVVSDGIWRRDFTNGFVEVDPDAIAVNIFLNDDYVIEQIEK
jgi:hypothetical protein